MNREKKGLTLQIKNAQNYIKTKNENQIEKDVEIIKSNFENAHNWLNMCWSEIKNLGKEIDILNEQQLQLTNLDKNYSTALKKMDILINKNKGMKNSYQKLHIIKKLPYIEKYRMKLNQASIELDKQIESLKKDIVDFKKYPKSDEVRGNLMAELESQKKELTGKQKKLFSHFSTMQQLNMQNQSKVMTYHMNKKEPNEQQIMTRN